MECLLHPGSCCFSLSRAHSTPHGSETGSLCSPSYPRNLCIPGSVSSCAVLQVQVGAPCLASSKLAEAPPSLLISRVFGPLPGRTELCVWNPRTRSGEKMSFLISRPIRNFHCDSELPGQNRKTDLCGSRELVVPLTAQSVGV